MKIRSQLFTLAAALFLSLVAEAQSQRRVVLQPKRAPVPVQEFGSLQRTKLLQMGRSKSEGAKRLGSVQRRALLTTGKAIKLPEKQRARTHYRR